MRFVVSRTTVWRNEIQPCEEAKREGENWIIELNSIDELLKFVDKYGDLVLQFFDNRYEIEIYDGYRE